VILGSEFAACSRGVTRSGRRSGTRAPGAGSVVAAGGAAPGTLERAVCATTGGDVAPDWPPGELAPTSLRAELEPKWIRLSGLCSEVLLAFSENAPVEPEPESA